MENSRKHTVSDNAENEKIAIELIGLGACSRLVSHISGINTKNLRMLCEKRNITMSRIGGGLPYTPTVFLKGKFKQESINRENTIL
jgi:hypothetical protein